MKPRIVLITLALIAFCSAGAFAQKQSSPQPVRDVDQPAKQPFFALLETNIQDIVTVPIGKVLVIESVSGLVTTSNGRIGAIVLYAFNTNNETTMVQVIAPSFQNAADNITYYTHLARTYVPAGSTVKVYWNGGNGFNAITATVSGHYVNVQ